MVSFHFEQDRLRYLIGRSALRTLIGGLSGIAASDVKFEYGAYGKPQLATKGRSCLQFNLSHSADVVLIALARGRAVGIDVEHIRGNVAIISIAARYFSANEYKTLVHLDPAIQCSAFFKCWTRKEAYLKARGDGLRVPLDRFEVAFAPEAAPRLTANLDDPAEVARWDLRELDLGENYAAALAVEGTDWKLKCWDWPEAAGGQPMFASPAS